MSKQVEDFYAFLTGQLECYKKLLEISEEEKLSLLNGDKEGLGKVLRKKENILAEINEQKILMRELIKNLMKATKSENSKFSFLMLNELANEPYSSRIENIRKELKDLAQKLKNINQQNALLVQRRLEYIKNTVEIFFAVGGKDAVYRRNGNIEKSRFRIYDNHA